MSSTTTATTSTGIGIGEQVSWLVMPSPRWPQPELSIGTRYQCLDVLGRYKCWSLREKSPAHIVWKGIYQSITTLLEDHYEHLGTSGSELMVEMFMIGKKEKNASPTILFSCESKNARQKAMDLVNKKSRVLESHYGVRMAQCSRLPRLLALGDDVESMQLPEGVYSYGPVESSGISVLIVAKDEAPPRKATIGGFLYSGNSYYGLTTAHAFSAAKEISSSGDMDLDFAFHGASSDDESSDNDDEEGLLEITSKGSNAMGFLVRNAEKQLGSVSSTSSHEGSISTSPEWQSSNPHRMSMSSPDRMDVGHKRRHQSQKSPALHHIKLPDRIGSLYKISASDNGLDWALVEIDFEILMKLKLDAEPKDKENMRRTIANRDIVNNITMTKHGAVSVSAFSPEPEDRKVLICLGTHRRPLEGSISGVASFAKGSRISPFQELWRVKLDEGSFADGDCGSWVLRHQNGTGPGFVCGHIISGFPESGMAYIVPAHRIFRDIGTQLKESVGLPIVQRPFAIKDLPPGVSSSRAEPSSEALRRTHSATSSSSLSTVVPKSREPPGPPGTSHGKNCSCSNCHKPSSAIVQVNSTRSHKARSVAREHTSQSNLHPKTAHLGSPARASESSKSPRTVSNSGSGKSISKPLPPKTASHTSNVIREQDSLEQYTSFELYAIRKAPVMDEQKEKTTWAKAEITKESFDQKDIIERINQLDRSQGPVAAIKEALFPFQQGQVNQLLVERNEAEVDQKFEWSIVQISRKERTIKHGRKETTLMNVFLKRAPRRGVNLLTLQSDLTKTAMHQVKPFPNPPPPPPPPQQSAFVKPNTFSTSEQETITIASPSNPKQKSETYRKPRRHHLKKYDSSDSSSLSELSSESDNNSDSRSTTGSATTRTTKSTKPASSEARQRRKGHSRTRSLSRSRNQVREHYKYHLDDRIYLPERSRASESRLWAPGTPPSNGMEPPGTLDSINAAYEAGKLDGRIARTQQHPVPVPSDSEPRPYAGHSVLQRPIVSYGRSESPIRIRVPDISSSILRSTTLYGDLNPPVEPGYPFALRSILPYAPSERFRPQLPERYYYDDTNVEERYRDDGRRRQDVEYYQRGANEWALDRRQLDAEDYQNLRHGESGGFYIPQAFAPSDKPHFPASRNADSASSTRSTSDEIPKSAVYTPKSPNNMSFGSD